MIKGNNTPLVSVIMPAYNGEKYIQAAINSIINQTYSNWELIVIDDASTDATTKIISSVKDDRIKKIYNKENKGISYSTNLGTKQSMGKYIALLDDDDIATPNRLEVQVKYLEAHPDIDVLGGRSIKINEYGEEIGYCSEPIRNPKLIRAFLLFYNRKFANGTIMYRRDFVEGYNLEYQENCYGMQDFKFSMDCSRYGNLSSIDVLLHYKRVHNGEETTKQLCNNGIARLEKYSEFQRENITKSGFILTDDEFDMLKYCLYSVRPSKFTVEEVKKIYGIFEKMINQAHDMKLDYENELIIACKKILGEVIIARADIF